MLGEKIGVFAGKTTGIRVLATDTPQTEVSIQQGGTLLGVEVMDLGTYISRLQPSGSLYGEGQGITMTKDGEVVAWKATGVGRPTGRGLGASWRGSIYYQTTSSKLGRLNGLCSVFEYETDENGDSKASVWEWK
jgi:hypothetical protein